MSLAPDQNDRATSKPVQIPTVLAVGCSDGLLSRCWGCLSGLGLMVRDCEPALAATLAASRRPLVIVVASAVYASDAGEIDALARDVRATLVVLDDDAGGPELHAKLSSALRDARKLRERRTSSGRYSLLPGELSAPPLARTTPRPTSEAPPTSDARPIRRALAELDVDCDTDRQAALPAARR